MCAHKYSTVQYLPDYSFLHSSAPRRVFDFLIQAIREAFVA